MPFTRFVQVGRVALVNYGPDNGKLCTILDAIDENKCLVDGPVSVTGVNRQVISFKRLALTDMVVKIPRQAREKTLKKALAKDSILDKWSKSAWGQKLVKKEKRTTLGDFDRFKLMVARKQKSRIVKKKISELKKKN